MTTRPYAASDVPPGRRRPAACAAAVDGVYGARAARAAGMHVFAYAGEVTPAAGLAGPGTTVFQHVSELPDLIAAGRAG